MGLLDDISGFLNTPEGMGLLSAGAGWAAGAQKGTPWNNIGRGAVAGLGGYATQKDNQLKQQLLQAQVAEAQQKQNLNKAILGGLNGASPVAPTSTPAGLSDSSAAILASNGITATPTPSVPSTPSAPVFGNVPPMAVMLELANNGGKELGKWLYEANKPNIDFVNGVAVDKNRAQPGMSIPQISTSGSGFQTIPDASAPGGYRVIVPNGAADAYRTFKNIDAASTAGYDLQTHTPPNGKPVLTTRKNLVEAINPDTAAINAWKAAGSPGPDKPFNMSVGGIPVQSEEDKARLSASVEVDKDRAKRQAEKGQSQENIMIPLGEIRNRLKDPELVLGNTPADRAKMIGHQYGLQSRASINTQRIRELANQLTLSNGSLGAGVSKSDTDIYERAYGQLMSAKSHADMVDAVDTMVRIAEKYQQRDSQVQTELKTGKRSAVGAGGWSATRVGG